jgi:hypothetical protein
LDKFLAAQEANRVVLPAFALMECFTGTDPVDNAKKSLAILLRHQGKVFTMRDVAAMMHAQRVDPARAEVLFDPRSNSEVASHCNLAAWAALGHPEALRDCAELGRSAEAQRVEMLKFAEVFIDWFDGPNPLPKAVDQYRRNQAFSDDMRFNITALIGELDHLVFRHEPVPRAPAFFSEAKDYYRIRYITALFMARFWWQAYRRPSKFSVAEFRQDLIDVTYVTAATYFDGLLTRDNRMRQTYMATKRFLDDFTYLPVAHLV